MGSPATRLVLHVVDAFTDHPFAGNPAAVCVPPHPLGDRWMQLVASEMHLSETAFVTRRPDGHHDLRWFTPTTEVDLCGHATLAATHLLGATRFHTLSGPLDCRVADDGTVSMDFPTDPPSPLTVPDGLAAALFGGSARPLEVLAGQRDLVVVLDEAAAVRSLDPELSALGRLPWRAVVVTAPGDRPGVDCVSRVFAPRVGVPEDPATGSAHCALAPLWAARTGRTRLSGEQASARGATIDMRLSGDRVELSGRAVTVAEVTLLVEPPGESAGRA